MKMIFLRRLKKVHQRCQGGYAAVALIVGYGLVAFRDPHGIRPLVYGQRHTDKGIEYMVASESVALNALGFELIDDVQAGEAVCIPLDKKQIFKQQCSDNAQKNPCSFEFVYLARPDSIIDDISVYKARLRMGEKLADKIIATWPNHDIDVVIPVPDTSRTSASTLSYRLGVKLREGFIKNRYIGRTFIMPGQKDRERSVRQKLNAISLEFSGKNVLLVDDSIVRGTTCQELVQMAREAGANKVYFASAAPPVRYPNVYGIDMPVAEELIAYNKNELEISRAIGADKIIYQDLTDLIEAVREGNTTIEHFEVSVFNGEYVTGDISTEYLQHLAQLRSDANKHQLSDEGGDSVIDLSDTLN